MVFVAAVQTLTYATNICKGQQPGDKIRNFTDCTKYSTCTLNSAGVLMPIESTCTGSQNFNWITGLCAYAYDVKCFTCPTDSYFIDMPVDYNCIQFVRCFAKHPIQHTCAPGLYFDPEHKTCNFERNVVCACPVHDIPARPLFIRDRFNCSR